MAPGVERVSKHSFPAVARWAIFLAFSLAVVIVAGLEISHKKPESRILLLSAAPPQSDTFWINAVVLAGGSVQNSSSELSQALIKNQNIAFNPKIDRHLLLIDVGASTLQSIRGDSSIQNYLENRIAAPGRPNFVFPLVGIFALLLAPVLCHFKHRQLVISILNIGVAVSCAFKLSTLYKVCGETGSTAYWLSVIGAVSAAVVAGVSISDRTGRWVTLAVCLGTSIAVYQVAAWTLAPATFCFACVMIVLFNCLVLGLLGNSIDYAAGHMFRLPVRTGLLTGVTVGFFLVAIGLYDHENQHFKSIGKVDGRPTGSLIGQNLKSISTGVSQNRVLLVTSAGCDACRDAKAFVVSKHYSWVTQLDIKRMGTLPYTPKSVPTLLILNENSIVTSEITGWSSDPLWVKSFEAVVTSNRPTGKQSQN
jgi:hypothetical protein